MIAEIMSDDSHALVGRASCPPSLSRQDACSTKTPFDMVVTSNTKSVTFLGNCLNHRQATAEPLKYLSLKLKATFTRLISTGTSIRGPITVANA